MKIGEYLGIKSRNKTDKISEHTKNIINHNYHYLISKGKQKKLTKEVLCSQNSISLSSLNRIIKTTQFLTDNN